MIASMGVNTPLKSKTSFWAFAILTLVMIIAAVTTDTILLMAVPFLIPAILFCLNSPGQLFILFFLLLPFSVEFEIGSLATDLPSEPMMVALMGIFLLLVLTKAKEISKKVFVHPLSMILIVHIAWIGVTTFFSTEPLVSFKYLLAKIWYYRYGHRHSYCIVQS